MKAILCALLTIAALTPAQVVRLGNYSGQPFDGWRRCTVDVVPPHPSGAAVAQSAVSEQLVRYVLGRAVGLDTHVVDIHVHLSPGELLTVDLGTAEPWEFELGPAPGNPLEYFGFPRVGQEPLHALSVVADGAAYTAHLHCRNGIMLHSDVWLRWYPDEPGWAYGEVVITASNPASDAMVVEVPPNFRLRFGDADAFVPGRMWNAPLLPAGTTLGDGQARSYPIVLVWREHLQKPSDWSSAGAAASLAICANGIQNLWPDGNPHLHTSVDPLQWSRTNWWREVAHLHDWQQSQISVTARSANSGAQADQIFVGGECMQGLRSLGAETVRYLAALGQSRRPCHHLEADGSPLSLTGHPQLVLWQSRPHWHHGVSPDRLGKPRQLTAWDTHDWEGPDDEHWLCNTLAVATRLTGSPALQWQLGANARNWLYSDTLNPSLTTSTPRAARAMAYAGLFAVHCWYNLEDRTLAEAVAQRWRDRVQQIYLPILGPHRIWQTGDAARIAAQTGVAINYMPYQNAWGAWGVDYACRILGPAEGRDFAYQQALMVLDTSWSQDTNGRWIAWDLVGLDPQTGETGPLVQGAGAHRTGWFDHSWFLPGIATVLDHDPDNPKARAIWAQNTQSGGQWVPPGVRGM